MATETKKPDDDSIPFFPDHARTEYWVAVGIVGVLFVVGIIGQLFPVGLGDPADPYNTPLHVKPEWYFLGLYQLLKFVPKTLGVLIPLVGLAIVLVWPFLDRKPDRNPARARRIRLIGAAIFFVIYLVLTIWGELS